MSASQGVSGAFKVFLVTGTLLAFGSVILSIIEVTSPPDYVKRVTFSFSNLLFSFFARCIQCSFDDLIRAPTLSKSCWLSMEDWTKF